ncbi:MAG: N-acetylmuramoyl-L-alanine amidase [Actinomycetota bacterium]|nr:N-acetylmuramoyl-L-alanine amidase [Actinomycetota bacterium]
MVQTTRNPAGARAMNGLIREGDHSQEVADVQARLRALEIALDDDWGTFGPSTKQAVRAFQQLRGTLVDGVVGPDTWLELVEASWRLGDRVLYLKQPPLRGDDVATLQARLNALGFDAGRDDGIFGKQADAAVRAFQKEYGVQEDGIFGPRSHAALVGLRVDRPGVSVDLREELKRAEGSGIRKALIVVDPGHGGTDPGEHPSGRIPESHICWDIAERLAARLVGAGARVRLSRNEAESPESAERAMRANAIGADLFLSLHLNAHPEPQAEGASTYYFRASRAGEALAEAIQGELIGLGLRDCRSHGRAYPILRETRMPAVLIEPAFISNPTEAARLEDPAFRSAVADAVLVGTRTYYEARAQV